MRVRTRAESVRAEGKSEGPRAPRGGGQGWQEEATATPPRPVGKDRRGNAAPKPSARRVFRGQDSGRGPGSDSKQRPVCWGHGQCSPPDSAGWLPPSQICCLLSEGCCPPSKGGWSRAYLGGATVGCGLSWALLSIHEMGTFSPRQSRSTCQPPTPVAHSVLSHFIPARRILPYLSTYLFF